jgi:HipA-like protein
MSELLLDVRLDSFSEPIGVLVRDDKGALAFAYTPEHAANPAALALSLSLPLTVEPYADGPTRAFFDNFSPTTARIRAKRGRFTCDLARVCLEFVDAGSCPL